WSTLECDGQIGQVPNPIQFSMYILDLLSQTGNVLVMLNSSSIFRSLGKVIGNHDIA
ncbi:hypothetical protein HAX54_047069, partial [Datura stramonium]|nr:hypothetical protein [Datura stramonium]